VSDPAIDAAQRALVATRGHGNSTVCEIEAAREALKPMRELHHPVTRDDGAMGCDHCWNCPYDTNELWPCHTAYLAYSTEELEQS